MIWRGSANTDTVLSEIASGWPLRSVIIARWPGMLVSSVARGWEAATIASIFFSARCGVIGIRMVASASLPISPMNSSEKPPAAMTRRARVFSIARRRSRSGAVTFTVSIRGVASERAAPTRRAGRPKRPSFSGVESGEGT